MDIYINTLLIISSVMDIYILIHWIYIMDIYVYINTLLIISSVMDIYIYIDTLDIYIMDIYVYINTLLIISSVMDIYIYIYILIHWIYIYNGYICIYKYFTNSSFCN